MKEATAVRAFLRICLTYLNTMMSHPPNKLSQTAPLSEPSLSPHRQQVSIHFFISAILPSWIHLLSKSARLHIYAIGLHVKSTVSFKCYLSKPANLLAKIISISHSRSRHGLTMRHRRPRPFLLGYFYSALSASSSNRSHPWPRLIAESKPNKNAMVVLNIQTVFLC